MQIFHFPLTGSWVWAWFTRALTHIGGRGLLALIIFVGACTGLPPESQKETELSKPLQPGNYLMALSYGERDRTYLLHIPPQGLSGRALPVVLNFHGGGGHATQQQEYTELDTVADREGFYTVYPNGTGRMSSHFLTWNAGNCCGYAKDHKIDDVGFSQALLSHLSTVVPIDHTRIYATGLSNGAMMAYRLAAEASDLVAAIAPVAGSMMVSTFAPSHAVPVMHVHSLDDPRAPYEGGEGAPFPLTNRRVTHPPVESQLHRWVERNQCQVPPQSGPVLYQTSSGFQRHQSAQKIQFTPCRTGADIVLWQLRGAGHVWPGGAPTPFQRFLGPPTNTIQINEEIWKFFSRYTRSPRNS